MLSLETTKTLLTKLHPSEKQCTGEKIGELRTLANIEHWRTLAKRGLEEADTNVQSALFGLGLRSENCTDTKDELSARLENR